MVRKVRGFTLIELIVVIAILAILLGIGLNRYNAWKRNISVESDVRKLYSIIQEARMKAFADKDDIDVIINGKNVTVKDMTANKTIASLNLKNPFESKTIKISSKGLFKTNVSVNVTRNTTDVNPDYNCIKISKYRVIMGHCKPCKP